MGDGIYLNLKDNQVVLFADIIGFKNAILKNADTTFNGKEEGMVINLPIEDVQFNERYTSEKQRKIGVKLMWVSDSIIISTSKENVDKLFDILVDFTNIMLCYGFTLRGAIALGKLYHENNIWGPAYIDAVEMEKKIAIYPRVIIPQKNLQELNIDSKYNKYIEPTEHPDYMQFDFFGFYIFQQLNEQKDVVATISTYINYIVKSYKEAECSNHLIKYVWLAEKLSNSIIRNRKCIDDFIRAQNYDVNFQAETEKYLSKLEKIKLSKTRGDDIDFK